MKKRSKHVYFIYFILMVLGLLLQGLLLSGHIPFVHLSQFRTQAKPLPYQQYQTVVASRDENVTPVLRMQRPTFQTGIIFPQWGTNAYDSTDKNWQIGLNDIENQTSAQWVEIPVNLFQSSVTSMQVTATDITPTPDAVAAGIRAAQSKYYHVFIVPLLSAGTDPNLNWSGSITFSTFQQMQEWFDSYWQALQPYVVAAAQAGAEEMSIGTELEILQQAPASLWNQLIDRIHQVFPGKLTYDMNWSSLYRPWERDAQIMEIPGQQPDPTEQAAAYDAALTNVVADKHIGGIYFWAWSVPLFQPNWKLAARILNKWYSSPQV
jgi:Glycoside Hydrolase Family 113